MVGFPCPNVNMFITSNLPALARHRVETINQCLILCASIEKCSYGAYDVHMKLCYLLSGYIVSMKYRKGWIFGDKNCAEMVSIEPDSLFWQDLFFQ